MRDGRLAIAATGRAYRRYVRRGMPILIALLAVLIAGCEYIPAQLRGGELIVMEVANRAGRPATLAVAAPGEIGRVIGSAEPAVIPPGQTVTVNFFVPPSGDWAIWANGGELMGSHDIGRRRGSLPMGIEISADGSPAWWCNTNCP